MKNDFNYIGENENNDIKNLMSRSNVDLINSAIEPQIRELESDARAKREENEVYQNEILRALRAIESNTANLYVILELISRSTEQQDELIEIFAEVLSIAKAKDKKEAESIYRKVMGKISQTVNDAETLAKVAGYATVVYELAKPIIEKLNV